LPSDERRNWQQGGAFPSHPYQEKIMTRILLALSAAAVALTGVATSADAQYRHHGRDCARWRHGHCVRWMNHGYAMSTTRHDRYRVGYVFGPNYSYTDVGALPQPYVTRYHLTPDYRYVYSNNTVYVVDPATYAITRILTGR
jgi:Ni/Co efflux regulator RcnB